MDNQSDKDHCQPLASSTLPGADLSSHLGGDRTNGLFHHRLQTLSAMIAGPAPPGNRQARDLLHALCISLLYYLAENEPPERQNAAVMLRAVTDALEGQESAGPSGLDLMFIGTKENDSEAWQAYKTYNELAQNATRKEREAALFYLGARLQTILAAAPLPETPEAPL